MMTREYYKIACRLDGKDRYLIWYSDDVDGLMLDESGFVIGFPDNSALNKFAAQLDIPLCHHSTSPVPHYDLDALAVWTARPHRSKIQCEDFLNAWNLFGDLANSIGEPGRAFVRLDEACWDTYDKLFWGNNPPALTPPGKRYDPIWSAVEVGEMVAVFKAGLDLFRQHVKSFSASEQD